MLLSLGILDIETKELPIPHSVIRWPNSSSRRNSLERSWRNILLKTEHNMCSFLRDSTSRLELLGSIKMRSMGICVSNSIWTLHHHKLKDALHGSWQGQSGLKIRLAFSSRSILVLQDWRVDESMEIPPTDSVGLHSSEIPNAWHFSSRWDSSQILEIETRYGQNELKESLSLSQP